MKAKLIHIKENVFKILSKDAIDRGTNLKHLIERIISEYAEFIESVKVPDNKSNDEQDSGEQT